jgi:methionine-rich copper-binding protein CopC
MRFARPAWRSPAGSPMEARQEEYRTMKVAGRRGCIGGIAAVLLIARQQTALAQEMPRVVASHPVADAVIPSGAAEYFVRFDTPVDHYRSRLFVRQDGQIVQTLHPRLNTAPDLLFALAPPLEPGRYELQWEVVTLTGRLEAQGILPFRVAP